MMGHCRFADTLVAFAAFVALAPYTAAEDVYLGLNTTEVFSRCGIEVKSGSLNQRGDGLAMVGYDFGESFYTTGHDRPIGYRERMSVAVYPRIRQAHEYLEYIRTILPIHHSPPSPEELIGDEMIGGGSGQRVIFRRKNIVIDIMRTGDDTAGSDFARQIDSWIQNDRAIAPLGTFDPPPEIVDAGIPATLAVRAMKAPRTVTDFRGTREVLHSTSGPGGRPLAYVNIQPQFRGLGDLSKLRLKLVHEGGSGDSLLLDELSPVGREFPADPIEKYYYVPDGPARVRCVPAREAAAAGVDGRFIMRVSVPSEPETLKLTLIAATEDNLIVTKNIEVRVVRAD